MSVRCFVLIELEYGMQDGFSRAIRELAPQRAKVLAADIVTGPYDVIVVLEADTVDLAAQCVESYIKQIPGIMRLQVSWATQLG